MALSFHDWMKQVKTDPAKMAKLDGIAREAEIARERDEDVAWEEHVAEREIGMANMGHYFDNRLLMVQHITPKNKEYYGFNVKAGMFYGVYRTPLVSIPVAWSGWVCGKCIALYVLTATGWKLRWINEDEINFYHICVQDESVWDESPWFVGC